MSGPPKAARVVFMGTPEFAVPCVQALAEHPSCDLVAAVCQPDRVRGRKKEPQPPPVKVAAEALGIPVLQPRRIKTGPFQDQLRTLQPTLAVVAAYGRILPQPLLDLPTLGCVNLHASLLPRWRGAAPIQWSIAEGDMESGVCLMQMDVGLDTGDVLARAKTPITSDETGQTLHDRLSVMSATLLAESLPKLLAAELTRIPQSGDGATYARMLTREDGRIDWTQSAVRIARRIRAFYPWPGAFTQVGSSILKLFPDLTVQVSHGDAAPGTVIDVSGAGIRIRTGKGDLIVRELQLQGRRRMSAKEFANGRALQPGIRLD